MARKSRFSSTSGPTRGVERSKPGRKKDEKDEKKSFSRFKAPSKFKDTDDRSGRSKSFRSRGKSNKEGESQSRRPGTNPFFKRGAGTFSKGESKPDRERGNQRDEKSGKRGESQSTRPSSNPFFKKRPRTFSKGEGKPDRDRGNQGDEKSDKRGANESTRPTSNPFFKKRPGTFSKGDGRSDRGNQGDSKPGNPFFKKRPRPFSPTEDSPDREHSRDGESKKPYKKPRERKSFVESRLEKQKKALPAEFGSPTPTDGLIRLNKFISNSGVCSRREADELIAMGLITVNGTAVTEMGYKVKPTDDVRHEGKRLKAEKPVYILLNKPKGYLTTTDDPEDRNTVMKLIEGACKERVYPVGRLDRNTSGLLLLTNDGELTEKLSHPSYNVKKIYKAELDRPLTKNDFQKILDGIRLEEGKAIVDDLALVSDDGKTVGLELHIGWNRIVRRIFETLGYNVVKLDRSVYATLDKKDLARGHWRFLRQDEVIRLKHFK
jgi:23S rRNA pseudouridine2605 synthase